MTGLIPRPFIDELLNKTDIVEFIDGYIPLKKRGTSHVACCPFHTEKTPSFNVVAKKQFYHCFGCGSSGNAISFAMNYLHMSFSDAVETLAQRLGWQVPRDGRNEQHQNSPSLYEFMNQICHFYQQTLKSSGENAITYLKQRHVSGQIALQYQLGYAPPGWQSLEAVFKQKKHELITTGMLIAKDDGKTYDRYRNRIMFPIHDRHGRIIGFGGRAIDESQKPKYLNSPETIIFQKNRELYGLHQALQQQNTIEALLVVEGYLDVIALAQHGVTNVVATLGTATSIYHIQLLSKYTKQLIFCFDGDAAGRQAAWRALESSLPYVNGGLDTSFIFLPEGHDPDSLIWKEGKISFLKRLDEAIPLNQFFFNTLTQGMNHKKLSGKSRLLNAAKPYLSKMSEGPYKQLLINELARLTHIEPHRVQQLVETSLNEPEEPNNKKIARSPMRVAIAILLQAPEIYISCHEEVPPSLLDAEALSILKTLMEQIIENPSMNTAKLVEAWRHSPMFDALNMLASWNHQVPEDALRTEFVDIVLFLAKKNQETQTHQLMQKAREQGLTDAERRHLQSILKKRHQSFGEA